MAARASSRSASTLATQAGQSAGGRARGTAPGEGEGSEGRRRRREADTTRHRAPRDHIGPLVASGLAAEDIEKVGDPGGFLATCRTAVDLDPVGRMLTEGDPGFDRET